MIYWCKKCNEPIFDKELHMCSCDGKLKKISEGTIFKPVFAQERKLLGKIMGENFSDTKMWYMGFSKYFYNGESHRIPYVTWYKEKEYLKVVEELRADITIERDYSEYMGMVRANIPYIQGLIYEAEKYICDIYEKYKGDNYFPTVSFSGGKDSTVVGRLVRDALQDNTIIHFFGDTTLEFPETYEYVGDKFRRENPTIPMIPSETENDFFKLCKVFGPPSQHERWCCTIFKTSNLNKELENLPGNSLSFLGIRHSESASRSKYERESESPKIAKQTVASPIIEWIDYDVWLYILTTGIDFNYAYRLGYTRVGCWCCPNNGAWSEFLSKVHMYEQYVHWRSLLIDFAQIIGKLDAEDYVNDGKWKARQGGNGLEAAQTSIVSFEPCATEENSFNYELQRPISEELYELFKPFGMINKELGNKRLGEVYIISPNGKVVLILQGRIGSTKLKVTIKNIHIAGAKTLSVAEGKVQCQLTKYQMCLGCKACESVCKHDAISVKDDGTGKVTYSIDDNKCVRCTECVGHFNAGCYMRKVLCIKRS